MNSTLKNKAIIYCRVSTEAQAKDWESLENQELACRQYCENNNIEVIESYFEALSWKRSDRPILNIAIQEAINNNANYFVIFDIDRFTRGWVWEYNNLKTILEKNWIQLKDSKYVIWESRIVYTNDKVDMSKYSWNIEHPSETTETILALVAQVEWKKINQRTITREIQLAQEWYQVRKSNFWYRNEKIETASWKKTIQVKDDFEGNFIIEMYELRAEWIMTDSEIAEHLNLKWCRKRSYKKWPRKPFDSKYIQELIVNPIYAWVFIWEWTWNQAIKTAYDWLVSIELWNKANKWKKTIIMNSDKDIVILYKDKEEISKMPIIRKKRSFREDFLYARALKCPICNWYLTWSFSTSRDWTKHPYYHCRGKNGAKHTTLSYRRNEVNKEVFEVFNNININNWLFNLLELISENVYKEKEIVLKKDIVNYDNYLKELNDKESYIVNNMSNFLHLKDVLEIQHKELESIRKEKIKVEAQKKKWNNLTSLERFKELQKNALSHIKEYALESDNQDYINLAFEIVYWWKIEVDNLKSHTLPIVEFTAIESEVNKNNFKDLWENPVWYPQQESNLHLPLRRGLFYPLNYEDKKIAYLR